MPLVPCLLCCPTSSSGGGGVESAECTDENKLKNGPTEEAGDERKHEQLSNGVGKDANKPSECDSAVAVMVDDQGELSGQYEQGEGIRQHLIDFHAKFVAKAFLYPDLSSSIHYWLMACVEYGTPPNDPMVSQICPLADGEALAATDTSPDDDSSNESTSADPLDFATLLSAFISNGNQLLNGGGNELEKKSSRKRCAGSHDGTNAKRRNGWHENGHLETTDELSIYDPHLFFDNTEEVACASGLVDSKAKNKVTCVVCKVEVCNTARQRHVFMVHVKKEDMYQ